MRYKLSTHTVGGVLCVVWGYNPVYDLDQEAKLRGHLPVWIYIYCCEQQAAYDAPRSTHISRYIRRWIPVPLIPADLFRWMVLSPDMQPRGRGFDSRSVTFPPPGFDIYISINQSIKGPHKAARGQGRSHIPAPPQGAANPACMYLHVCIYINMYVYIYGVSRIQINPPIYVKAVLH